MMICMYKPHTLRVRKSGDRMRWACDAGLSWCPLRLPGTVVSSLGYHPTSLVYFFFSISSCNSLKGASYQRAAFSSTTAASSYSHACNKFVGAQLGEWGKQAALCWGGLSVPGVTRRTAQLSCVESPSRGAPVTVLQ